MIARLVIEYRVSDYDAWKRIFDSDPLGRHAHGATGHTIERGPDDSSSFLLGIEFATVAAARAFRDMPAFQQVWEISGAGKSWIVEQTEAVTY